MSEKLQATRMILGYIRYLDPNLILKEYDLPDFDRSIVYQQLMQPRYTIEEIRNYIESQDSLGDVAYNLSPSNIEKANEK